MGDSPEDAADRRKKSNCRHSISAEAARRNAGRTFPSWRATASRFVMIAAGASGELRDYHA